MTSVCREHDIDIDHTPKPFPYTDWSAQAIFLLMCASVTYCVLSKCFSTGVPRHRTGAIITAMLVLLSFRFYACLCGTHDCPFTRAGIKQTGTLVVSVLVLLLLCSDLRADTHEGQVCGRSRMVLLRPQLVADQRSDDTLHPIGLSGYTTWLLLR